MKILFTGGGSGGHFYPIIAVAEEINRLVRKNKLVDTKLYFMSTNPYNEGLLFENNIIFKKCMAGKVRRYFSVQNIFDVFVTGFGILKALWEVFNIYPDVVFSKGGYASFPAVLAAKILRIPVVLHESDSVPGKVNLWTGKFAKRIAVSFPDAEIFFPKQKIAYTGNPIRDEVKLPLLEGAHEFFKLEKNIPVILIVGGSLGAEKINDTLMDILPQLVSKYQVIHQTGKRNFEIVKNMADSALTGNQNANRYHPFEYLNSKALTMAAGASSLVVSRAGSTIFEIALWGLPSIIIPITESNGDHQRKNAFAYARKGACFVIEEENLSNHILLAEIERIMENPEEKRKMSGAAKAFGDPNAAEKIAREILEIALPHEV